jgi:long-chain-fatty-acid--CoA ligase ACSBG
MGYYKNCEETAKSIDENGYLHSGDNGKITKDGVLFITGRAKELIITAGGENIPPILLESEIKAVLPFVSSVMLIGDMRRFLTCLVGLREDPPNSGQIDKASQEFLADKGCLIKSVAEAKSNEKLRKIIMEGLKKANERAISRAQHVQDFYLMPEEFTV